MKSLYPVQGKTQAVSCSSDLCLLQDPPFVFWEYRILWPSSLPLTVILQNHVKEKGQLFSLLFFLVVVSS